MIVIVLLTVMFLSQACGAILRELEGPVAEFVPKWVGDDMAAVITQAGQLFAGLGGYPLPKRLS